MSHRSVIRRVDACVTSTQGRIGEKEAPPLVGIARGRAGGISDAIDRAGAQTQIRRRIDLPVAAPKVSCLVAEITDRTEPIAGKLPLISDIPIGHVGGL